ncbi:ABC transporter substrate-binding protein [Spirochaetia bacterium]|nr:ABC transporter substrate-binding protein [Spirochaetia bacterium]
MKKRVLVLAVLVCGAAMAFAGGGGQQSQAVPLSYLAWNLGTAEENNLERRMLAAFQTAHPDVKLTILEIPQNADGTYGSYDNYLNSLAASSSLPDVFMWASVPDAAGKNWAYNVSDYALKDPDYLRVNPVIRESAEINGHVYGIPNQLHLYGMAINLSIFEELNVPPLPFRYTVNDLQAKIAQVTTPKYKGIGWLGVDDWGPFTIDPSLGYATFNGTGYHFTSPAYAQSIAIYRDVVSRNQSADPEVADITGWLPEGVAWAWGEGYEALRMEGSWAISSFVNGTLPFRADFLPLANEKVVLIPDLIFVGASTKNAALAYELAAWMAYSEAGQKKKVEVARAADLQLNGIPLAPGAYPEVDTFFLQNYRSLTGFIQLYQMIQDHPENVILEGYKVVPGFDMSRFSADTGVLGTVNGAQKSLTMRELVVSIIKGERQLADYAAEMERVANNEYRKALELVRNK